MTRSPTAEAVDAARRRDEAAMTPDERARLALALGRRDLHAFAEAQGIPLDEARARLDQAKQRGRRTRVDD